MPDEQGDLLRGKGFFAIATSSGAGESDSKDAGNLPNSTDAVLGTLARRCGAANLGAFITRETPPNISADYEVQLNALRAGLRDRLRSVFGIEVR